MQQLFIAGNVGKDAELRRVGEQDVLNFSLAVDNGKDRSGDKRPATWFDCAVWGKRATALQSHVKKGTKLALTGRPGARAHDGKAYLSISVNELTFMGGGQSEGSSQQSNPGQQSSGYGYGSVGSLADLDDEIPFAPEVRA